MAKERFLTPRLYAALELAFKLHGRDARKGCQVPALAHLLSVCALVQTDGGDEDEAIAALLHDSLEDKSEHITREEIQSRFGVRVLDIIEVSTDTASDFKGGEKEPWEVRKTRYIEHIKTADPKLLRVTIADKIDNARAILADHRRIGSEVWRRFNAPQARVVWYYTESTKAYLQAGVTSPLLEDLQALVHQMKVLPRATMV